MNTANLDLPTGSALEREIENIEAQSYDERVRNTIAERLAIARNPLTTFVSHDDAFAFSQARLLAKLADKTDAT